MKKYLLLLNFLIIFNFDFFSQINVNHTHSCSNNQLSVNRAAYQNLIVDLTNDSFFKDFENEVIGFKTSYNNKTASFEKLLNLYFIQQFKKLSLITDNEQFDKQKTIDYFNNLKIEFFEKMNSDSFSELVLNNENVLSILKSNKRLGGDNKVQANCSNVDFADGTTSSWAGSYGTGSTNQIKTTCASLVFGTCLTWNYVNNPNVTTGFNSGPVNTGANVTTGGVHTIMTGGTDPNVPIQVVPPSGGNSIRLGNGVANSGYRAQILKQTFNVSTANPSFIYQYAVVLDDEGHTAVDQPFFNIRMYDQNNNLINCASYDVDATSASSLTTAAPGKIPGFVFIKVNSSRTKKYKDWSTVTVPLLAYVGQNVTIEFETSDCSQGGHYGYAYIQCKCNPIAILSSLPAICNGQTTTLTAPPGAATYTWSGPGVVSGVNTQTAVVNLGGTYTVNMTTFYSPPQLPCQYSQTITLGGAPTSANPSFNALSVCLNTPSTFSNTTTGAGSPVIYSWNFGDGSPTFTTSVATNPVHTYTSPNTYSVVLTVNNGCPTSTTVPVTVNNQLAASFLVNNSCLNTVTNFTSTATPTAGIASHNWDYGDGVLGSGANPSHAYANPGIFNVTYSVTNGSACPGVITNTVSISPNPVISFTSNAVCLNSITNFTNTTTVLPPSTIALWAWDYNNDGVTDNTTQNPSNTFTTAGIYNVELKATTNNGCSDSLTVPVKVNALPIAAFSPVNACVNINVVLNNSSNVAAPATIANYSWNFGASANPSTGIGSNPTPIIYLTSGTKTISVLITANNSCTATVTKTVEVYAKPVANFSSTSVCQSTATAFTDLSTPTGFITGWDWDFTNNGSSDNSTNAPTNTYASSGTFTAALIVTNSNSCKDTVALPVNVWGHALPNFIPASVCFGAVSSFSNTTDIITNANIGTISNWTWNFGDGSTSTTQSPTHTYTSSITPSYNVTLTATTSHNCLDKIVKAITVNVLPTATFTAANACINSNVVFTNSSNVTAPDNIVSYDWNFGSSSTPSFTSSLQNPTSIKYNTSGVKTITLTVTANTTCSASITNTVQIYPQPVANFSATSVCQSTATAFTDLSTPTGSITGWTWDFRNDNSSVNTTNSPTFIYPTSGTFTASLIVTSSNNCKDTVQLPVNVWGHTVPNFAPNSVCFGTATLFTNLTSETTNPNTGLGATYVWNFADSSPTSNVNAPTHTHTYSLNTNANAVYSVSLTATSIHGCVDKVVKPVNVYAIPTASFTSDSVCLGAVSQLSDASTGTVSNYAWDFLNDGTIDVTGISNPSFSFPAIGNNNVSYTVSSSPVSGLVCTNVVNTIKVWVNPIPVPDFTFVNKCINSQPNSFDGSSSTIALGSNVGYVWTYGNGANSGLNTMATSTYTYLTAGVFDVTLTVVSNKGCQKSITKQVTVYQKPDVLITNSTACDKTAMTFTAVNQSSTETISNWYWDFNNTISTIERTTQLTSFTFPTPGANTVALVAQTSFGCRDTIKTIVNVSYIPNPQFSVDLPSGCPEHCVTFTDLTPPLPNRSQITEWNWTLGDGSNNVVNSTNASVNHCYQNSSSTQVANFNVTLVVKTNDGCINTITKQSYINVFPKPIAAYVVNPNPGSVLLPLENFTNQSQNYTKWWWNFDDNSNIDSVTVNPDHNYESDIAKTYNTSLIVQNVYGCRDIAYYPVEIAPEFSFYIPNAFTPGRLDGVNDVFNGKGFGISEYQMLVFDRWGEKVFETNSLDEGWDGSIRGKSGDVKQDVYVWKVYLKDIFGKDHKYVGHVTLLR